MGNKYIFAGHKTLTKPFSATGEYLGNDGQTKIEVGKDIFVPITFSGKDVFYQKIDTTMTSRTPLENSPFDPLSEQFKLQTDEEPHFIENEIEINRDPASNQVQQAKMMPDEIRTNVFDDLQRLENALVTNNHEVIQELLPDFDKSIDRLIQIRTTIGSTINKVDNATNTVEKENLTNETYKSKIEDADVAELFTDLTRQQNVLNATYKSSAQMMNNNLMKYIN